MTDYENKIKADAEAYFAIYALREDAKRRRNEAWQHVEAIQAELEKARRKLVEHVGPNINRRIVVVGDTRSMVVVIEWRDVKIRSTVTVEKLT
jgi:hypothetical protein